MHIRYDDFRLPAGMIAYQQIARVKVSVVSSTTVQLCDNLSKQPGQYQAQPLLF